MSKIGRYIERVSNEDASTSDVDLTPKDPVVPEAISEPEEIKDLDASCLVDAEGEGQTHEFEIKEIKNIQTALEEFEEILEGAEEAGGLHPEEAEMLNVGMEHFAERLGVKFTKPLPSLEDYSGGMTRKGALTVSQEAMVVIDKALIDKAIELVKRLLAKAKEFISKLDIQTGKVDQILDNVKARYRKWKTGEVTFKSRLGGTLRSEDMTPQGQQALVAAGKFSLNSLYHFQAAVKSTRLHANVMLSSEGGEADVAKFKENLKELWGAPNNPFLLALGHGKTEIKIGTATTGRLKEDKQGIADRYTVEFLTDYGGGSATGEAEVTLTKAEFNNLVNTTTSLNDAVKRGGATYKELTRAIVEFSQLAAKGKTPAVVSAINLIASELSMMHGVELENLVRKVSSLRNGVGVFLLLAGSEFDKAGESTGVANNNA